MAFGIQDLKDDISREFEQKIEAFGVTNSVLIQYPNTDFDSKEVKEFNQWLRHRVLWGRAEKELITGDANTGGRTQGIVMINIFSHLSEGLGNTRRLAGELFKEYNEKQIIITPGSYIQIETPRDEDRGENREIGWYQWNFIAPWHHHRLSETEV